MHSLQTSFGNLQRDPLLFHCHQKDPEGSCQFMATSVCLLKKKKSFVKFSWIQKTLCPLKGFLTIPTFPKLVYFSGHMAGDTPILHFTQRQKHSPQKWTILKLARSSCLPRKTLHDLLPLWNLRGRRRTQGRRTRPVLDTNKHLACFFRL